MLLIRRLPGIIFNHVYVFISVLTCLALITYLLLSWGFICTNWEPWNHVNKLCTKYSSGEASGDLCHALCREKKIHSLSCHAFHAGKEAVFSASVQEEQRVVIKSAQQTEPHDIFHWIDNAGEHYPSENEFSKMIKHRVSSRLNYTISDEDSERLALFPSGQKASPGTDARHAEMREIWRLLQDNEYLLSMAYADKDIFPQVLGSCGQFFVVEHLQPAMEGEMAKMLSETEGWERRVHLAVLLIGLIEEVDAQDLLLCDVKPSHFGFSPVTGRLKVLDLDVTLPHTVANAIIADYRPCSSDSDCSLFDCRSSCNPNSKICDSPVTTSNFQVVCDKLLVGWWVRGGVMLPGLLMTPETPPSLAILLRSCSDPGTLQRLINMLIEMDNHFTDSNN